MSLWNDPKPNELSLRFFPVSKVYFALLCWSCNHDRTEEDVVMESAEHPSDFREPVRFRLTTGCPVCRETDVVAVVIPEVLS